MVLWLWLCATVNAATLAILPFDNHTGDPDHDALGTGVSVMLMSDLGAVGSLQLVERSRLKDVIDELKLGQSDLVDPKTAAKAGKVMGADWILTGALMAVEPDLRLDARIVEVQSGKILGTGTARGPIADFFEVEKDLALVVTEKLGIALSAREAAKVGRVATESFQAFREWSRGLQAIDRGEVEEARKRFSDALRFDSGFSAATSALDELKAALDRSEVVREKQLDEELAWLEDFARDHESGKADYEALSARMMRLQSRIMTQPPAVQKAVARQLIDMKLPESVSVWQGMSVNEFATWLMVQGSMLGKDREGVLTWSRTYVDRYPSGVYYASVRAQLDQVMLQIDKERRANQSGVRATIEAEHRYDMHETRCANTIVPARRAKACRDLLEAAAHAPEVDHDDLLKEVLEGARDAGDVKLARDLLAFYESRVTSPEARREAREDVEAFEAERAALGEAERELDEAIAKGRTRYYERYLRPFAKVGAWQRGLELAERIPDADQRAEQRWEMLAGLGRVDELERIHAAVMNEVEPFVSESSRRNTIERLKRERDYASFAIAMYKLDVANDLQREGLVREGAELLDEIVAQHLTRSLMPPASLLLRAAMGWQQVMEPDAPGRSRAHFERLVEDYPDSSEAETARTMLALVK